MSKQLLEEALADVKQVKEIAERNAKQAIIEAVTPKIREFIENQLLGNTDDDAFEVDEMTDDVSVADAITPPDAEGKVTLDIDALTTDSSPSVAPPQFGEPLPEEDYELSLESMETLTPVLSHTKMGIAREFQLKLNRLGENIGKFMKASRLVQESNGFKRQIAQMISQVEDMYGYVQGSVADAQKKGMYEAKLESYFKCLTKLQEQKTMSKNRKNSMNEEDVTLKLTGLPDEIDLDSVGVDLITGDEEGGDEVELDLDGGDDMGGEDADLDLDGGDESGDDLGDLDLDGEDEVEESTELSDDTVVEIDENMLRREIGRMKESAKKLSDNTVVEIDESMLRREIARMKSLREEAVPSVSGHGVDSAAMDDFGGGAEEGDPWLDGDVTTESDELEEGEECMDEMDDVRDEPAVTAESRRRRLGFEKRLQERAKARGAQLKKEAVAAQRRGQKTRVASLKKEYASVVSRFNESVARSRKISRTLAESAAVSRVRANNNVARKQLADKAARNDRAKLAELNLNNVKLTYTNKLLQNESLTRRQKADIIERLDEAQTAREAKLVFESLTKASRKTVTEGADRKVLGSSSRTARPASTQTLNEGFEAERWAQLAGIKS